MDIYNTGVPQAIIDLQSLEIVNKKRVWKPFMEKYNCQKLCELGVFQGENFSFMIEHSPQIAVAIDSWKQNTIPSQNDMGFSQEELNKQYETFAKSVSDKPFVKIYRELTSEAVIHFMDDYFDLIYIDADHSYEGCLKDLTDWYPKVKKKGFLVGDDYREAVAAKTGVQFGVIKAVNEFTDKYNLKVYELPRYGWAIIK